MTILNYVTWELTEEYQKYGLGVNINKTEHMCAGEGQRNLTLEIGKKLNASRNTNIQEWKSQMREHYT